MYYTSIMTISIFRNSFYSNFIYSLAILRKYTSQTVLKTDINGFIQDKNKLSTLFVPGRHGFEMYQIVKPVIDSGFITSNLGQIKLSCDHRGIEINLDYTLKLVREWESMRNEYSPLYKKEQEMSAKLKMLTETNPNGKDEAAMLEDSRAKLIERIIVEKEKIHKLEDVLMPLLQKIPHILHINTPLQLSVMDLCHGPITAEKNIKSHTEIAKSLLEFSNRSPITYFMKGKLSQLDIAVQSYFYDKFSDFNFLPFSCADFCKSFIIEAIGRDPYSNQDSIKIESKIKTGQQSHLVGGASLESFCAYLTNMNVSRQTLPVRHFSLGRHYNAAFNKSKFLDLFSVVQSNNVHCIILYEPSSVNPFDMLLQCILECYTEINIPFRTVHIAAKNLTIAESRRTQLELWSNALKEYIPVAYVSEHDDFISKRLEITFGELHQKDGYCNIVEGAVLNVQTLIGCIVENCQTANGDFDIPDVLQKYILS